MTKITAFQSSLKPITATMSSYESQLQVIMKEKKKKKKILATQTFFQAVNITDKR